MFNSCRSLKNGVAQKTVLCRLVPRRNLFPQRRSTLCLCLTPRRIPLRKSFMSLRKVYGGTPVGNESRCDTCANARIIEGYAESERLAFCDAMYPPTRVPFSVRQCSMYEDKRLPDFYQMEKIAWEIRSKNAGAVSGFVLASDLENSAAAGGADEEDPEMLPAAKEE